MRLLFLGDIVGRSGREAVTAKLPRLIRDWKLDFVAINGENAAGGFGITEAIYQEIVDAGADAITLGNHAWDQREALVFIERAPKLIRPLNFPAGAPGRGAALLPAKNGARVLVVNLHGPHLHGRDGRSVRRRSSASSPPMRSRARAMPSSSTCTPRPPARSSPWAISSTGA